MTVQHSTQTDVAQQAIREFEKRMQNPLQAIEDVRIEEEANCTIGAGYGASSEAAIDDSPFTQQQRQQLRILVTGEFFQMLSDCNLGAGLTDAIRVGRQILSKRLKHPSEDVLRLLMAALDDAISSDDAYGGIPDSVRAQVRGALCAALSEQDWEDISSAATSAIQRYFRQQITEAKAA